VPYTHKLQPGKTVIQSIYDSHFEGVEQEEGLKQSWLSLEGKVDTARFAHVLARLEEQVQHAEEWCDMVNTYFYRKSGISDALNRNIY
jgi:alpha-glucuronidase